jgi:hypothetical protein
MNIIELSYLITPIAGAVGGAFAAKAHGGFTIVLGILIGLLVGVTVIRSFRWLISALSSRISIEAQNRHLWVGVLMVLFLPLAFPVAAFGLASVIVLALFQS